jgi:hypothetical protein
MASLLDVLELIRERIERHRASLPINEQNTKAALIDPVLRALGWDIEDVEEVHREYKVKTADNPVDYALLVLRTPRLFIEAKALGDTLEDRRWAGQIMGYATVAGVEWVVLTNGDEYRIYNSHAPVPVDEKLFRTVRVHDDCAAAAETLRLLSKGQLTENALDTLWQAYFVDRQIRGALEGLFAPAPDAALVRLVGKRLPKLPVGEVRAGLSRVRLHLDFPQVEMPARTRSQQARPRPHDVAEPSSTRSGEATLLTLIQHGVLQPPLDLTKTYKGQRYTARVEADGSVLYAGQRYTSLSTAATAARRTVSSGRLATNGWVFWQFQDTDGLRKPIDMLRGRHLTTRANLESPSQQGTVPGQDLSQPRGGNAS